MQKHLFQVPRRAVGQVQQQVIYAPVGIACIREHFFALQDKSTEDWKCIKSIQQNKTRAIPHQLTDSHTGFDSNPINAEESFQWHSFWL